MVDNMEHDLKETGGENTHWIHLVQDKVTWQIVMEVPVIMNHWVT
jgi:hypothetical protein